MNNHSREKFSKKNVRNHKLRELKIKQKHIIRKANKIKRTEYILKNKDAAFKLVRTLIRFDLMGDTSWRLSKYYTLYIARKAQEKWPIGGE